jgi:hypothetical protein
MATNNFHEQLRQSHEAHALPLWEEMYKKAFPGMVAMHDHPKNGYWQQAGIDRTIVLDTSKVVYIDEKVRGRNRLTGKVYSDIAVEYVSNDNTGSLGWAEKPLAADYIAYAIAPLGIGYMLPVQQFQTAWLRNKDGWLLKYGYKEAKNRGYNTLFCPVPVNALFPAIGGELRIAFAQCEWVD